MDVIVCEGLTKHFGDVRALQALDLTIGTGEVFGFLGPNGAGKTTTIRLVMGFLTATSGQVHVFGRHAFDEAVAIHRRVGYLPSDPAYPLGTTGRRFLDHLAKLRGGVDPRRVDELVDAFEVELDRPIATLSRGNRQKLGVVQAFMHDADLVVLDEASSGLDPLKQATFHRVVREAAASGRTVFLSSHVIAEVEHVADRVGIVRDGTLVALESVETLRSRAVRRVEIRFAVPVDPAPFAALREVRDVRSHGEALVMDVAGSMDALVKTAARFPVVTFSSDEADLSEIFLSYYERTPA
jgi:ABC-2 type transport system ATP-binding protein